MSDLADRILAELERQLAEGEGTGRRPHRIQWELHPSPSDEEFRVAVRKLVDRGDIFLDEIEGIGFIYLVPIRFKDEI